MSGPRPAGQGSCVLDGERVPYALRRSARTTLGITVTPKAELKVTAPQEASTTDIERVLIRKAPWITRQLRETSALPPAAVLRFAATPRTAPAKVGAYESA